MTMKRGETAFCNESIVGDEVCAHGLLHKLGFTNFAGKAEQRVS